MIVITGHEGFLGNAIAGQLNYRGIPWRGFKGDLLKPPVGSYQFQHDDVVVHCAYPQTDGIGSMETTPADIVRDGLRIDLNVIEACAERKVTQLICFGSVCSYPEVVSFPATEEQLWSGYPEAINAPYGNAKRMQLELLKAYHRQYGLRSVHLILGNLYGPGDHSNHVIPSTIAKVLEAQRQGEDAIEVWGTGAASRDFLYVDDAAQAVRNACLALPLDGVQAINVCSGREVRIGHMAETVMALCGFQGGIRWNAAKPEGQPRRWFGNRQAYYRLDWTPRVDFSDGLQRTIDWMRGEQVWLTTPI